MSFEYKIIFKDRNKTQILNEICVSLKSSNNFKIIESDLSFINIKNEDSNSKWQNLATIEVIDEGYFFTANLNGNERNFIINEILMY